MPTMKSLIPAQTSLTNDENRQDELEQIVQSLLKCDSDMSDTTSNAKSIIDCNSSNECTSTEEVVLPVDALAIDAAQSLLLLNNNIVCNNDSELMLPSKTIHSFASTSTGVDTNLTTTVNGIGAFCGFLNSFTRQTSTTSTSTINSLPPVDWTTVDPNLCEMPLMDFVNDHFSFDLQAEINGKYSSDESQSNQPTLFPYQHRHISALSTTNRQRTRKLSEMLYLLERCSSCPNFNMLNFSDTYHYNNNNCSMSSSGKIKRSKSLPYHLDKCGLMPLKIRICNHWLTQYDLNSNYGESYICLTDIFRTFFNNSHWDEFRSLLERQNFVSVRHNELEVLPFSQVEYLATVVSPNKQIRALSDQTINNRPSANNLLGTLSDNDLKNDLLGEKHHITTRNSDLSDIVTVQCDHKNEISAIVIRQKRYVRLVDVSKYLASVLSKKHISHKLQLQAQVNLLKQTCRRIGVNVLKCSPNQKARLVLYGQSVRHSSLHVIEAHDLQKLIKHERKENVNREQRKHVLVPMDDSRDGMMTDSGISSAQSISPKDSSSSGGSNAGGTEDYDAIKQSMLATIKPNNVSTLVEKNDSKTRNVASINEDNGSIKRLRLSRPSEGEPATHNEDISCISSTSVAANDKVVCNNHNNGIAMIEPRACSVSMLMSDPLPVMAINQHKIRGAVGKYYDHLYTSASNPCIACVHCKRYYSVEGFLNHSCAAGRIKKVANAQLMVYVDNNVSASRMRLWVSFCEKRAQFSRSTTSSRYNLPNNLVDFYDATKRKKDALSRKKPEINDSTASIARKDDSNKSKYWSPPYPVGFENVSKKPRPRGDVFDVIQHRIAVEDLDPVLGVGMKWPEREYSVEFWL